VVVRSFSDPKDANIYSGHKAKVIRVSRDTTCVVVIKVIWGSNERIRVNRGTTCVVVIKVIWGSNEGIRVNRGTTCVVVLRLFEVVTKVFELTGVLRVSLLLRSLELVGTLRVGYSGHSSKWVYNVCRGY
jgi:hypothetical protein